MNRKVVNTCGPLTWAHYKRVRMSYVYMDQAYKRNETRDKTRKMSERCNWALARKMDLKKQEE